MIDEKVLSTEEEELIANISGVQEKNRSEGLKIALEKEATKAAIIEKASEVEDFTIEAQQMTKEDHLLADMQKLAGLDVEIKDIDGKDQAIQGQIDKLLSDTDYSEQREALYDLRYDFRKQFNLLKKDIALRAEQIWAKTENVDPCLGVKVTMRKNRELVVDEATAIEWCFENNHQSLLTLNKEKYSDLIETEVFQEMPGTVDKAPIPAVKISLKPFTKND